MSETNGTPVPIADLKEQVERARLNAELRQIKATESVFDQTQAFVNPAEPLFDSPDFVFPWYGENIPFNLDNRLRGELLPVYITEYGLKILRDYSRWLMAYNPWAIQIAENKVSYICGKGFGYTCAPTERRSEFIDGDKHLCKIAQRYLDKFMERTNWGAWEQQLIKKDTTDGECFLRFFHLGRGEVTVRPVEPEHVRSPGNQEAHQSFGIETPQNDILSVRGFWVVEDPSYKWYPSFVPAEEILHIRSNVGPTAKRGYPCLIPVRQNLSRAANLLKIMSVLASAQSSVAMIRKWKQYSVADIQGFQNINSDLQYTDPISGQQRFSKRYLPGTQLDTPENVEYEFPASKIASAALVEVLQAELRTIASRFNWPEYMVGADSSNSNYASTQVAEAPGVKQLEREQASYARAFGDGTYSGAAQCGALWRVLSLGVRWGGLPHQILKRVKLQAEGPSLVARDKEKETTRAQVLNQAGLLGKKTWSKWEGLDRAQEKEDLETEKPAPGAMPPGMPGQPPPPQLGPDGKPMQPEQEPAQKEESGWETGVKESFDNSKHPRGQPANAGQFGSGGGGKQLAAQPAKPQTAQPHSGKVQPPANQKEILSKINKEAHHRDLNDAMRELSGVNLKDNAPNLPKDIADQFDAHGTQSLQTLTQLLNGGVDQSREFYSSPLSQAGGEGHGVTVRDSSSFIVLGHPGQTIKKGGIPGVLVDPLHEENIPDLQKAFPGVKFVSVRKAAEILPKVAGQVRSGVRYKESKDASGHEHKPEGPGGGQFTGRGGKSGSDKQSSHTKNWQDFAEKRHANTTPHTINRSLPGGEILVDVRDPSNIRANFSHEVGHQIYDYLMDDEQRAEWSKIAKKERESLGHDYRGVTGDPEEDFPEAFSAWTSGDPWQYEGEKPEGKSWKPKFGGMPDSYRDFMQANFGSPKEIDLPDSLKGEPKPDTSVKRDKSGRRVHESFRRTVRRLLAECSR